MKIQKMKTNFNEIWLSLEHDDALRTLRAVYPINGSLICYIGRIGASNSKMFQIEISNSVAIHKNYLKRFYGVEIRVLDSSLGKKDVTIILSDNDLLDVFVLFLDDLLKDLELINDENEVPTIVNQKVGYWGKLFARIKGELLSIERQRGLFGELTFLNTLLSRSGDHIKCIISWVGPEGANQDFNNERSAVEVKVSKATKPSVHIASELQLDYTKLDHLFLCVFHIDELSNGTDTLEKLISEIKSRINNQYDLVRLFEEKLDQAGIPEGTENLYDNTGFIIRSKRIYKIQEGFPVLTNEIIENEAIHNVQYQIDLSVCEPYEVDQEVVIRVMI